MLGIFEKLTKKIYSVKNILGFSELTKKRIENVFQTLVPNICSHGSQAPLDTAIHYKTRTPAHMHAPA